MGVPPGAPSISPLRDNNLRERRVAARVARFASMCGLVCERVGDFRPPAYSAADVAMVQQKQNRPLGNAPLSCFDSHRNHSARSCQIRPSLAHNAIVSYL